MKTPILAVLLSMASVPALAATFVYVSNAEDGNIGMYTLQADGSLQPGARVDAAKVVMPMAVSPDKRFLVAAVRSKPYEAYTYAIDKKSGALKLVGKGPLAESYPYITIDGTGRFLLGASYGAHQVGVNPIGKDGKVGEPIQVIPTARNAHAIRVDNTNRFVFVPHLGTDQMFQFVLDKKSGKLSANTPPVVQLKQGTGPRHIIVSKDNKFVYLLNELNATVTTLALDAKTGTLKEVDSASALPPDTKLGPGRRVAPSACPDRLRATPTTTSGLRTSTSRRTAASSMRPSARQARSAHSGSMRQAESSPMWEARRPRNSRAALPSIRAAGSLWCRARNRTRSRPTRSMPRPAR